MADQAPEGPSLHERIAAELALHYLATDRAEADVDGRLPCRCGGWREPDTMSTGEESWDHHIAAVIAALLDDLGLSVPAVGTAPAASTCGAKGVKPGTQTVLFCELLAGHNGWHRQGGSFWRVAAPEHVLAALSVGSAPAQLATTPPPRITRGDHQVTTLTATRGLPGSGKTSWAREQLAAVPHGQLTACSRDEIRRMLHNATPYMPVTERQVTLAQHAIIRAMLQAGVSVIVHDTNLDPAHLHALGDLARRCAAEFRIHDLTHVPLEVCIERDQLREHPVGSWFIRESHARWLTARPAVAHG